MLRDNLAEGLVSVLQDWHIKYWKINESFKL